MPEIIWLNKGELTAILAKGIAATPGASLLPERGILAMGEEIRDLFQVQEEGFQPPGVSRVIDLRDCFLFPALVDSHVHLGLGGERHARQRLKVCLESGIAAVRDAGHKHGGQLLEMFRDGRGGVEVQGCGWAIHAPGEYGGFLGRAVRDWFEFKEVLDGLLRMGALFFKLILTGPVDFRLGKVQGTLGFQGAELKRMVSKAKDAGLGVMVHANGIEGVRAALEAGVDTLEHGYLIDMETVRKMAGGSVTWVPTLVPVKRLLERHSRETDSPPGVLENIRRIYAMQQEHLAAAQELGVRIAAGTDAGAFLVSAGKSIYEEIRLLCEAGLGLSGALQAATCNGARILRHSSRPALGQIRKGHRAHLLAMGEPGGFWEKARLRAVICLRREHMLEFC